MNNKIVALLTGVMVSSIILSGVSMNQTKELNAKIESMQQCVMQPVSTNSIYISDSTVIVDSGDVKIGNTYETVSEPEIPKQPDSSTQVVTEASYNDILTKEEVMLIASIVVGEAEGEGELGQRLVADTILNRVESEKFPDTVHEVTHQPGQYDCLWNGRLNRCNPTDKIFNLVMEEAANRTNKEVIFFRTGHYGYGKPLFQEGHHYFCGI